jgi:hypothetical protein
MSSLQRRIAILTGSTAKLVAQLRELERLREQVKKARPPAKRAPQRKRRNGHGTMSRILLEAADREPTLLCSAPSELAAAGFKRAALG